MTGADQPISRRVLMRRLGWAGVAGLAAGCARITGREDAAAPGALTEGGRALPEGGIGGTGIVGTVTGFGSILINGLAVALPADAEVTDAFGPRAAADIAPGMTLTVEAAEGPGGLEARRIAISHPLVGPVEAVARDRRRLVVLGTEVVLEARLPFRPATGERVAVSGLWRGSRVVASRIDRLGDGPSAMAGALQENLAAPSGRRLGGRDIALPAGAAVPAVREFATMTGRSEGGVFRAETLALGRFTGAAGPLARLSVEGYLEPVPEPPGLAISGLGHSFDAAARPAVVAGRRAIFVGPYTGTFDVAAALPLPDDPARRPDFLVNPFPVPRRPDTVTVR